MRKKVFVLLITLLGVYLIFNLARGSFDSYQNAGRLLAVEKRLAQAKEQNQKLKDELKYRQSPDFVEKEARDKLGLSKKGEVAIVTPTPEPAKELSTEAKIANLTTTEQWQRLFLGK